MQFAAKLDPYLHREPSAWWFVLCLALIAAIAFGDYATSYELNLSILYLVPVMISTWILGRDGGITISILASAAWLISSTLEGHAYSHPFYHFWDAAIKFVTFALFAIIISELKIALSHADERFVTVLEGLDAAVYVTDLDGRLLYANEQFHRALAAGSSLGTSAVTPSPPRQGECRHL
jgi:PAS domain-containing protein